MKSAFEIKEIKHTNINTNRSYKTRNINQSTEKPSFPIIALEMLTQSVPQIHSNAYNSSSHGGVVTTAASDGHKTSPLALLAATCSSIGKSESVDRHKITVAKSQGPPMHAVSSDSSKSSFKPYKSDIVSAPNHQSKPCHNPASYSSSSPPRHISPRRSNPDGDNEKQHNRLHNDMLPSDITQIRDGHTMRSPHTPAMCSSSSAFFLPKVPPHHPYHGLCELGCSHCSTMRGLTEAPSPTSINNRMLPMCMCANCLQNRASNGPIPGTDGLLSNSKLPTPLYGGAPSAYGPQGGMKLMGGGSGGYPVSVCPDPHCFDCMKASHHHTGVHQSTLSGVGLKAYGPHVASMIHPCAQDKSMVMPMSSNHRSPNNCRSPRRLSMNSSAYNYDSPIKSEPQSINPFVCNWVSEGKHCGKTFVSSEELLQHLRTHTSQRQHAIGSSSVSSISTQGHTTSISDVIPNQNEPCSVHGCQCHLQPKLLRNTGYATSPYAPTHPYRYQPYARQPLSAPPNPIGFASHSMLHY